MNDASDRTVEGSTADHPDPRVPVSHYWDLSTSHVTPADLGRIPASELLVGCSYPEGAFASLDAELLRAKQGRRALAKEGFSPAFAEVVEQALRSNVYLLRFDADAAKHASLPDRSRDWERPTGDAGGLRPAKEHR